MDVPEYAAPKPASSSIGVRQSPLPTKAPRSTRVKRFVPMIVVGVIALCVGIVAAGSTNQDATVKDQQRQITVLKGKVASLDSKAQTAQGTADDEKALLTAADAKITKDEQTIAKQKAMITDLCTALPESVTCQG